MMKNQNTIGNVIHQFESRIVSKVQTHGLRAEEHYGAGFDSHPLYLTRTERPRFIRSYYQLWGILTTEHPEQRQSKLRSISLKRLLYLCEISWLPNGMGAGEDVDPDSESVAYQQRIQARQVLSKQVLEHTESTCQRTLGKDIDLTWAIAMDEDYSNYLLTWDHWQSYMKEVVCGI